MSKCSGGLFTCIVVILASGFNNVYSKSQQTSTEKTDVEFSKDFMSFLTDLGSIVYKYKKKDKPKSVTETQQETTVATHQEVNARRAESTDFHSQKAAFKDVLMMKLVSYYEDKYKLAHHETATTSSTNILIFKETTQNDSPFTTRPTLDQNDLPFTTRLTLDQNDLLFTARQTIDPYDFVSSPTTEVQLPSIARKSNINPAVDEVVVI